MSALVPVTTFLRALKPTGKRRAPMSWEDIMRDRAGRGLERDARELTNDAPCTAPVGLPRAKSAAAAATMRKTAMRACACRLCALALNPPMTFTEQARFVGPIDHPARDTRSFDSIAVGANGWRVS